MSIPLSRRKLRSVCGFTLVEMLVVVFILCVIIALLLPNVRMGREAARRMSCSNNMKNVCLAMHNYADANGHFPSAMGGTGVGETPNDGNANRLSGMVAILPYIEQDKLWQQIANPSEFNGVAYPAMGPAPWVKEYTPWQEQFISTMRCPSNPRFKSEFARTNYAFCIGDLARDIHQTQTLRGAFAPGMISSFADLKDGGTHTIAIGEIGNTDGRAVAGQFASGQSSNILDNPSLCLKVLSARKKTDYDSKVTLGALGRGGRWADGAACYSLVNTILPPNSPSCAIGTEEATDGIYSVGSYHTGGALVAMMDGSVRFIDEDIDAGDPTRPTPTSAQIEKGSFASPYGVWGALGTIAGEDKVD